jgi:hypothetical protein
MAQGKEETPMASVPGSVRWSVEQLLEAVEQLSPDEQLDFRRRLAARQAANGRPGPDEVALVRAARSRLSAQAERRLRRLIARSERGELTPKELADYQSLAQQAQRIDAARAEALVELARRWGVSAQAVQAQIDRAGPTDGT